MAKRTKEVRMIVARLDRIVDEYKEENPKNKRDWRTYEQQFAKRARTCFSNLEPLIDEAVSLIKIIEGDARGNDSALSLKQMVLLLLLKHFCGKSNRSMEWMVVLFAWLTDVDIGYKTIERLYSNEVLQLALFNLHVLLLKKKGLLSVDCCGDGTGYSVFIREHYATEAQKLKDKAKEQPTRFVYSFTIMDIKSRMYIGYGTSFKCEKDAFENALIIAGKTGINVESLRLDRYFSAEAYVDTCQKYLGKTKMYIIPKSNISHLGLGDWCEMVYRFADDTKAFLKEYFQRNQSESGISEDKKRTGWRLPLKREERIETAHTLTSVWHNLFWLGGDV